MGHGDPPASSTGPDGLSVATMASPPNARAAAIRALHANGFAIDGGSSSRSTIRTLTRTIAADSSIVVTALITPVDLTSMQSMITLSATLSVASAGIHNATVVWHSERPGGPWRFLVPVRDSLRQIVTPAP